MKVLSLFGGIECGRVALDQLGVQVEKYYSSEIDPHAIKVSSKNYPDIIHLGDATKWQDWDIDWSEIDLLLAGFPCQNYSLSGSQTGTSGVTGRLVFTMVDILNHLKSVNSNIKFLFENVKMKKGILEEVNEIIGVYPYEINSRLLTGQNRPRNYWVGQNKERLTFNDYICDQCNNKYEKGTESRISRETSSERKGTILGETQERQVNLCNLPQGILKNRKERYDQDLFNVLSRDKQEEHGQEERQGEAGIVQERVLQKEQGCPTKLSEGLQQICEGEICNEKSRPKTSTKSGKTNENTFAQTTRYQEEGIKGGINGDPKYEKSMYCLQCNDGLNNRPHSTYISWGDQRFEKFTGVMSEMQFKKIQQNNGRVFDTYKIVVDIPEDQGILLKDILEDEVDTKYTLSEKAVDYMSRLRNGKPRWEYHKNPLNGKAACLTANMYKGVPYGVIQELNRKLTPLECERLQGLPDNFSEGISSTQRYKCIGNGWSVPVIKHILKNLK